MESSFQRPAEPNALGPAGAVRDCMRAATTMRTLPMHFIVHDLDAGVRFYSAMFASAPDERKPGCAKWTLGRSGANVTVLAPRPSRGLAAPRRGRVPTPPAAQMGD